MWIVGRSKMINPSKFDNSMFLKFTAILQRRNALLGGAHFKKKHEKHLTKIKHQSGFQDN